MAVLCSWYPSLHSIWCRVFPFSRMSFSCQLLGVTHLALYLVHCFPHHFLVMKLSFCCLVARSCPTLSWPPSTVVHRAAPSMGFLRQEYCSGLLFLSSWCKDGTCVSYVVWNFHYSTEKCPSSLLYHFCPCCSLSFRFSPSPTGSSLRRVANLNL